MTDLAVLLRRTIGTLMPEPQRKAVASVRNLLVKHGLYKSMVSGESVGPDGLPVPWFTYSATNYLAQLDLSAAKVFEWGSGNSTLWWQRRVAALRSIEHDVAWYREVACKVDGSVDYCLISDPGPYVEAIRGNEYDIIVIDGEHRPRCVREAPRHLKAGGVIVFDNSDWYPRSAEHLRREGLIQIDFAGFGPINDYTSVTSLFLDPDFRPAPTAVMPRTPAGGIEDHLD